MIKIVPFDPSFCDLIIELILAIQRNEFGIEITAADQPDLANISEFYQKGTGNFWVALEAETLVGTISLLDIGNNQVALRKMFVKKEYRGAPHNIAGLLLQTALSWAREQGVATIYLGTTPKFLAAHRFYEKNGFDLIPKESLPSAFPIMKVDTRFYFFNCR
ncbi:MAG: GNAT family N-acetyltransferase [Proteobacteria bacterium]|nr:GNAT family N-acetyltransferase [Pseudomonadota bacterium]